MAGFNMDDYVDVAERINTFYKRFPDGSLRTGTPPYLMDANGKTFVVYHAQAYRTPDDTLPGDGWAWEPVPGPTQFTKDSELMNAETAAWGRAIVSLGFSTKKIASRQEVQNRSGAAERPGDHPKAGAAEAPPPQGAAPAASSNGEVKLASEAQRRRLFAIKNEHNVDDSTLRWILHGITGQESTAQIPADKYDAVIQALETEVPFA